MVLIVGLLIGGSGGPWPVRVQPRLHNWKPHLRPCQTLPLVNRQTRLCTGNQTQIRLRVPESKLLPTSNSTATRWRGLAPPISKMTEMPA